MDDGYDEGEATLSPIGSMRTDLDRDKLNDALQAIAALFAAEEQLAAFIALAQEVAEGKVRPGAHWRVTSPAGHEIAASVRSTLRGKRYCDAVLRTRFCSLHMCLDTEEGAHEVTVRGPFDDHDLWGTFTRIENMVGAAEPRPTLGLLTQRHTSIFVDYVAKPPAWTSPIVTNYALGIEQGYRKMRKMLTDPNPTEGRVTLISGPPGTGKTHLLQGLVADGIRAILVSPEIASELATPGLQSFLRSHAAQQTGPIVLFIEDADLILRRRDEHPHGFSPLSAFLNATDGLLADILDIRVVATINEWDTARVDPAVCRSGRMAVRIDTPLLPAHQANRAAAAILSGYPPADVPVFDHPVALSGIYQACNAVRAAFSMESP